MYTKEVQEALEDLSVIEGRFFKLSERFMLPELRWVLQDVGITFMWLPSVEEFHAKMLERREEISKVTEGRCDMTPSTPLVVGIMGIVYSKRLLFNPNPFVLNSIKQDLAKASRLIEVIERGTRS